MIEYLNEELDTLHGENFMAILTKLSVVISFTTGTLGIFATLVHVFIMRMTCVRHTEYSNNYHTIDFFTDL